MVAGCHAHVSALVEDFMIRLRRSREHVRRSSSDHTPMRAMESDSIINDSLWRTTMRLAPWPVHSSLRFEQLTSRPRYRSVSFSGAQSTGYLSNASGSAKVPPRCTSMCVIAIFARARRESVQRSEQFPEPHSDSNPSRHCTAMQATPQRAA